MAQQELKLIFFLFRYVRLLSATQTHHANDHRSLNTPHSHPQPTNIAPILSYQKEAIHWHAEAHTKAWMGGPFWKHPFGLTIFASADAPASNIKNLKSVCLMWIRQAMESQGRRLNPGPDLGIWRSDLRELGRSKSHCVGSKAFPSRSPPTDAGPCPTIVFPLIFSGDDYASSGTKQCLFLPTVAAPHYGTQWGFDLDPVNAAHDGSFHAIQRSRNRFNWLSSGSDFAGPGIDRNLILHPFLGPSDTTWSLCENSPPMIILFDDKQGAQPRPRRDHRATTARGLLNQNCQHWTFDWAIRMVAYSQRI